MTTLPRIKSFVINVEKNTFRRDHVLAQKEKSGLDLQIFTAITPATADQYHLPYNDKKSRKFSGRGMLPTEIACGLSHLELWRALIQDDQADYYLIFEDDIVIETNLANLLAKIDFSKIDFLKLSGKQTRPMRKVKNITETYELYRYAYGPLDAAAYILSKRKAQQMIDYCETLFTPIDILMDRSYDHKIPVYGILPYPVSADFCFDENSPFYSSIGERKKYADDITKSEKIMVKIHRLWGSAKRRLATLKLNLMDESTL